MGRKKNKNLKLPWLLLDCLQWPQSTISTTCFYVNLNVDPVGVSGGQENNEASPFKLKYNSVFP